MRVSASALPVQANYLDGQPLSFLDEGDGPVLLLVHGSLCDLRYWRWQVPSLSKRFRVIAPSLRCYWPHTADAPSGLFNVRQHASDLAHLIDDVVGVESVHLLGHSRGAQVALELAQSRPESVSSLILADPALQSMLARADGMFLASLRWKLADDDVEGALAEFIDAVNGEDTWRRMTGWFKEMVRDNAATLASQLSEPEWEFDEARAGNLQEPVLLLGGEFSPARYAKAIDVLEKTLPRVQRDVIPRAAHGMNLGNAPAFNKRVERFISELQPMVQVPNDR